jgi:hypothetical protein
LLQEPLGERNSRPQLKKRKDKNIKVVQVPQTLSLGDDVMLPQVLEIMEIMVVGHANKKHFGISLL